MLISGISFLAGKNSNCINIGALGVSDKLGCFGTLGAPQLWWVDASDGFGEWEKLSITLEDTRLEFCWYALMHHRGIPVSINVGGQPLEGPTPSYIAFLHGLEIPIAKTRKMLHEPFRHVRLHKINEGVAHVGLGTKIKRHIKEIDRLESVVGEKAQQRVACVLVR